MGYHRKKNVYPWFFFNQYKTTLGINTYNSTPEISMKTWITDITTYGAVQRNESVPSNAVVRAPEPGHQVGGDQLAKSLTIAHP